MKKVIVSAMFIALLLQAAAASALEIAWMYVQQRQYGETAGTYANRLGFGLVDDELRYLISDAQVSAITLVDPAGHPVALSAHEFGQVEEIYGSYDSKNGQWYYSTAWEYDSWFSADIQAPLIPGQYLLKVAGVGGKTAERAFTFNRLVRLPVISSESFTVRPDTQGNLLWRWEIPEELGRLSLTSKTRARASIDIFAGGRNVGYFSIVQPTHMGFVFIPREVVEAINGRGDRFELKVSLETRDKNNRTYSKGLVFQKRLPAAP